MSNQCTFKIIKIFRFINCLNKKYMKFSSLSINKSECIIRIHVPSVTLMICNKYIFYDKHIEINYNLKFGVFQSVLTLAVESELIYTILIAKSG